MTESMREDPLTADGEVPAGEGAGARDAAEEGRPGWSEEDAAAFDRHIRCVGAEDLELVRSGLSGLAESAGRCPDAAAVAEAARACLWTAAELGLGSLETIGCAETVARRAMALGGGGGDGGAPSAMPPEEAGDGWEAGARLLAVASWSSPKDAGGRRPDHGTLALRALAHADVSFVCGYEDTAFEELAEARKELAQTRCGDVEAAALCDLLYGRICRTEPTCPPGTRLLALATAFAAGFAAVESSALFGLGTAAGAAAGSAALALAAVPAALMARELAGPLSPLRGRATLRTRVPLWAPCLAYLAAGLAAGASSLSPGGLLPALCLAAFALLPAALIREAPEAAGRSERI